MGGKNNYIHPFFICICLQDRQIDQRVSVSSTEIVCRVEWSKVGDQVLEPSSLSATLTDGTDNCRWALTDRVVKCVTDW